VTQDSSWTEQRIDLKESYGRSRILLPQCMTQMNKYTL